MHIVTYNVQEKEKGSRPEVSVQDIDQKSDQMPKESFTKKCAKRGLMAVILICLLVIGIVSLFALHFAYQRTWSREYTDLEEKYQRLEEKKLSMEENNLNETLGLRSDINRFERRVDIEYTDLEEKYQSHENKRLSIEENNFNETLQLRGEIELAHAETQRLRSDSGRIERRVNAGLCELRYGDYCYFVEESGPATMNMNAATWSCERKNATLGNIYSAQHFDMMTNYYRTFFTFDSLAEQPSFGLKTGMKFDKQANVVYLSDASRASFVHWESAEANRNDLFIVLSIHSDKDETKDGYFTADEGYLNFGAICQMPV